MLSRLGWVRDVISSVHRGHIGEIEGKSYEFSDGQEPVEVTTMFSRTTSQCKHIIYGVDMAAHEDTVEL